jgi:membrane-bound ClpP family serine protease
MLMKHINGGLLLLFLMFFSLGRTVASPPPSKMVLNGFLGKEELARAHAILEDSKEQETLIIEINSSSGDLTEMMNIARTLYELKALKQLKVIAYIDEKAIGPAAILPFLADAIYASLFVSWGDIPQSSEGVIPTNVLRNQVRSFINPSHPKASLFTLLADAMTDPNLVVVDDHGWKLIREGQVGQYSLISSPGQPLVVNQNQLKELGIVEGILPLKQFEELYIGSKEEKTLEKSKPQVEAQPLKEEDNDFQKFIHFNTKGPNTIGHILIDDREGGINQSTWLYVKQALSYYTQKKPIFVILELNTPGGEVFAAQKISDALKDLDTQYNIPVVAFINNWAISAGAMLAYSCRFITAVKDASMGAAEPVYADEMGKMEAASEKVNSALRTDFANRAAFFGRNPLIAEAMVDKDMILVLRHGKVTKLDSESQIRTKGPDPDFLISPKGKLLTLSSEQLVEFGVANLLLPPEKLTPITTEEEWKGEWPASKMLLFQAPFFNAIPEAHIDSYRMDWKTRFFVFLATPLVSSLLFMGLMVGAYLEFSNPGLSLPGFVAGLCLFLIILSTFSLQIANWLELILLLTGVALLLVELFVLPTFGLLGILGLLLFIIGLFGMLLPSLGSIQFDYDTQTLNAAGQYFFKRLAWLSATFVTSLIIIALLARYVMPQFSGFQRFVLSGHEQEASKGFIASGDLSELPQVGEKGSVMVNLRPAGKVIIHEHIYDAISTGNFIEAGQTVVVTRLDGSTVMVREVTEGEMG